MIDPDALDEDDDFEEGDPSDLASARVIPTIKLPVVNEEHVSDQVIRVLARHPNIFQRNGSLVKITRKKKVPRLIRELSDIPAICTTSVHTVREQISANFRFETTGKHGEPKSASCPEWLKNSIHDRGEWSHVRPLTGVVTWPAMRTDGSFISRPGYDEDTGLFYVGPEVSVPECPSLKQAQEAAQFILEPVSEFPFQNEAHRAAWFALPLTLMIRYAIDYAPLWVFDAPTPGTGKTLLAELAVKMVTGGRVAKMVPSDGSNAAEEDRKRIMSIAQAGEIAVLIDNVVGAFGNAAFDAAITTEEMSDRPLGTNNYKRFPMRAIWMVSGNNVMIRGDMQRRVLHCRVDPQLERPEERVFRRLQGELVEMVSSNRGAYLEALMTVLRAASASEPPKMKQWGSFEMWGHHVRSAALHCGLIDPAETRDTFRKAADMTHEARIQLLSSLHRIVITNGSEFTTKELYGLLNEEAREAAAELGKCQVKDLSAQKLAYVLRAMKGRVAGGKMISSRENRDGAQVWTVQVAE